MAQQTVSNLSTLLRQYYPPDFWEAMLNEEIALFDNLDKIEKPWAVAGRDLTVRIPVVKEYNWGAKVLANDSDDLPLPRTTNSDEFAIPLVNPCQSIRVSVAAQIASSDKAHASVEAINLEIEAAERTLKTLIAIQMHGDGTGVLCLVNGTTSASTTLVVDTPGNYWIEQGMFITVTQNAAGTGTCNTANNKVVDVSDDGVTVTLTTAVSCTNNYFVLLGTGTSTTVAATGGGFTKTAIQGLASLVTNTGTIFGINRATAGNAYAKAKVSTVSAALSQTAIETAVNTTKQGVFGSGQKKGVLGVTDFTTAGYLSKLLTPQQRIVNSRDLEGGYRGDIKYFVGSSEVTFLFDHRAYGGRCYFIAPKGNMGMVYGKGAPKFQWWQPEGSVLVRDQVNNTLSVIATLYGFMAMAAWRFGCHVQMNTYTAPA